MILNKLGLNSVRKKNLLQILTVLFPEYKYISVKSNGYVRFRKHWATFGSKVSLYELLFTELSKRLSKYRNGSSDYIIIYNDELTDIMSTGRKNLIDYLYREFSKIKTSSKTELLLEDNRLSLKQASVNIVTIGRIVKEITTPSSIQNGFKETCNFIKKINSFEKKRSTHDRFRCVPIYKI